MKRTKWLVCGLVATLLLSSGGPARAETYAEPNIRNIIKSMIRFGALDIYNDKYIDVVARTMECGVFQEYYKNEFKWQKIRGKLRDLVRSEVVTYPTGYAYKTALKLDRYDFEQKIYPFEKQESLNDVNVFTMISGGIDFCDKDIPVIFPSSFKLVLDKPSRIPPLPLSEVEGKELAKRMEKAKNMPHLVFLKFNVRVTYIAALEPPDPEDKYARPSQVSQKISGDAIAFDSRLDSIEYYEDPDYKKLIYIYRP